MGGWIRIEDRMPPEGVLVLSIDATQGELIEPCIAGWQPGDVWLDPEGPFLSRVAFEAMTTHWYPLPQLPNEALEYPYDQVK